MAGNGFKQFIEENTKGAMNKAFLGLSIAEIATADNKLKALVKTLAQMVLFKPLIAVGLVGAFGSMSKSIRALVKDTGSLRAALDKIKTIQGLHRTFAPFVGGINAAKTKVAELVNFAARSNLHLNGVAAAERSLQDLTHGVFAGEDALQILADRGAETGNSLEATADATGQFYAALRSGAPIAGAAENLRSMGLIGDDTVNTLVALQQSGATNAAVFSALIAKFKESSGALKGMQGDLQAVEDRYEDMSNLLKQKFGAPFTDAEIKNTRNMADAMAGIAPVVERLAPFLEKLTGGFSTAASTVAKWAAENPVLMEALGNLVEIGTSLIAVISAIAGINLALFFFSAAAGAMGLAQSLIAATSATGALATAITAAGRAAQIASLASGVGILLALATTAYGIYLNFAHAADEAAEAQERLRKSHDETNRAMEKQIANARNLREEHEAVAKAAQNTAAAYKEYQDALKKQAASQSTSWKGSVARVRGWLGMDDGIDYADNDEVKAAKANYFKTRQIEKEAKARAGSGTYVNPERAAIDREQLRANAVRRGDYEGQVRLGNLDTFANHYERLRDKVGDVDAVKMAQNLTSADIQEHAAGATADHLARIGLGGEAGGGGDVQKQIRDLNKDMKDYLVKIDAKLGGVGTVHQLNLPQDDTENMP